MDKPGVVDMVAGAIWIGMGVFSMLLTIVTIGAISLWSFVPIGVGVVQFGRGSARYKPRVEDSPEEARRREHDTALDAMVFVAADLGEVSPARASQIDTVSQEMFGGRPDVARVRALAEKAYDLEGAIARNAAVLAPEARLRVVQAARAVAQIDVAMGARLAAVMRLMDAI